MNIPAIAESTGDDGFPRALVYRTPSRDMAQAIATAAEEKGFMAWWGMDNFNYSTPIRLWRTEVYDVSAEDYADIVVAAIRRHESQ